MKKVSNKERLELYEKFFMHLHFLRHVAGNEKGIIEMLEISDQIALSNSTHSAAGKPLTEEQMNNNVNAAFERLRNLP